eukprot:CAMPEP_0181509266 /NCGR_PEP_ID=MMETSP1110-20121109/60245_1 /TAXON_ID=174948 /ORGANISM="Symbiodinium sp., Strain CCMP421" /LENGTH=44 /DNA_ID= /DNA_START= /DNA_END= /DNA_ORIENTATION=
MAALHSCSVGPAPPQPPPSSNRSQAPWARQQGVTTGSWISSALE